MNYLLSRDGTVNASALFDTGVMKSSRTPVLFPSHYRSTLRGLGDLNSDQIIDDMLNAAEAEFGNFVNSVLSALGFGTGRREADVIVPVQNRLMYALGLITDQIAVGQNPSLAQLQSLYAQVVTLTNNFVGFVLSSRFTDRRASGQALNTVMPYIDGTCGYAVPLGQTAQPVQFNCLSWGAGTIGGPGTNGIMGSLRRAIEAKGGNVNPNPVNPGGTPVYSGFGSMGAVAIGIAAIYLFSRRR